MTKREFEVFMKRLLAFFNKSRTFVAEGAAEEWFREMADIPGDRLEAVLEGIKAEEDSFPRNLALAVKKYAYRGPKSNGNNQQRIYVECPDCDGRGMIHVGRINDLGQYSVYVFRCLTCHQADGDIAAQGRHLRDLLADGWAVDSVDATISRKKRYQPGEWVNPAILAAQKTLELRGESEWP